MDFDLSKKLDDKTLDIIKFLVDFAKKSNIKIYFVGGLVRDFFLNFEIKDIDIVLETSAIDFCKKLETQCENFKIKSIHEDFNTAKGVFDSIEIDFASTRQEDYPKSGCLPVIKSIACPISDDLIRRDFSINALAMRLKIENDALQYDLIDNFKGLEDLKNKKLRVLHSKSFIDDPTRILRGLDFELRFNFKFDKETNELKNEYLKAPDRSSLSISRVDLTLHKLFCTIRASECYKRIIDDKLYKIFTDETLAKAAWGKKIEEAIKFFKVECQWEVYQNALRNNIIESMQSAYKINQYMTTNYEIYNCFKNISTQKLCLYYAITGDRLAKKYFTELKDIKIFTTGETLLKNGFNEGRQIGIILEKLLEEKLNGTTFRTPSDELIFAKNNF